MVLGGLGGSEHVLKIAVNNYSFLARLIFDRALHFPAVLESFGAHERLRSNGRLYGECNRITLDIIRLA